ncbi:1,4-dihydroxy-2-naphthoate polyprenyltransferase [Handroanthus impetiginosus]|uniref:1,4-dihydroxy-2-naphthoate polyprenyltransferase n=1 Tax=Handroanthus impetiginosus TaxID=429701 RepID=A0A2G9GYX0_9LAMI|nr:1,4-dihydroxy-2-naphthoate polyprenyltransferase [Handroanthus impetiginosus]
MNKSISTSCRANKEISHGEKKEEDISRGTLIWRAAKLPMYTVALIPITVGTAAAYLQTGEYSLERYFILLASFVLVNAWVNLSNDVYDFDTGADKNKKESVVNMVGSRTAIHILSWLMLALGFAGLASVAMEARNPRSILLLVSAIFCGYIYQCPPFRLSYHGLGEPLCFASFGPFSTIAFYLLQSTTSELPISKTIVSAAVLVGFTSSLVLFCSHFHQIEDDKAVGKISPLVRLGTERGSKVVKMAVLGLYWLVIGLGLARTLPYSCIMLCTMTLPMGNLVVSFVQENHKDKTKIFMAKYYCVRLHAIFGAALAAGLVASRMHAEGQLQSLSTCFHRPECAYS